MKRDGKGRGYPVEADKDGSGGKGHDGGAPGAEAGEEPVGGHLEDEVAEHDGGAEPALLGEGEVEFVGHLRKQEAYSLDGDDDHRVVEGEHA